MLNSHPRLCVPEESWFILDLVRSLPLSRPLTDDELREAHRILAAQGRWHESWGLV